MSITEAPVVAGFDAAGIWHDDANGEFAKVGWSSAKALAIRAIRGLAARDHAKASHLAGRHEGVWLTAADNYLSRVGAKAGQALLVRYDSDEFGIVDAIVDGHRRPVRVKWERFSDVIPGPAPDSGWLATQFAASKPFSGETSGPFLDDARPSLVAARRLFDHDLGDGWTSTVKSVSVENPRAGEHGLIITGNIGDPSGENVGYFERYVYRDADTGVLVTENAVFNMDDGYQGRGIGFRFYAAAEDALAAAGVSRVDVSASSSMLNNGGYSWSRAGFDWSNEGDPRAIGRLMLEADPNSETGQRLLGDWKAVDYPTPGDVAADKVGKAVLMEHGWNGERHLSLPPANRVTRPVAAKNKTAERKGSGSFTRARIMGQRTGRAVLADNYLARHGHPKGDVVTVDYVDERHADVHTVGPNGEPRKLRVAWSRFTNDRPPDPEPTPSPLESSVGRDRRLRDTIQTVEDRTPLPDDLKQAVADAYTGDIGNGYHTEVVSVGRVNIYRNTPTVAVRGDVLDGRGNQVGVFARTFSVDRDGTLKVTNDSMHMDRSHQGKGVGARFLAETDRRLAALGVDEVHVSATTDTSTRHVGAYTAARAGFDWDRQWSGARDAYEWAARIRAQPDASPESLTLADRLSAPIEQRLAELGLATLPTDWDRRFTGIDIPDGFPTPNDVALDPAGRKVLLGLDEGATTWHGVKHLPTAATPPAAEVPRVHDLLVDPAADPDVVGHSLFTGTVDGHHVTVRSTTRSESTSGPEHLARTETTFRVAAEIDTTNGPDRVFYQVRVTPGTDGNPFVTIYREAADSGEAGVLGDRFVADTVAPRAGADVLTAMSPPTRDGTDRFIEDGWKFSPHTDALSIRHAGDDMLSEDPSNPVAKAWATWDGNDVTTIPQPQTLLEPENRNVAHSMIGGSLSYLGEKRLSDRTETPWLPKEGGYVDWADVPNLPEGTRFEAGDQTFTITPTGIGLGDTGTAASVELFQHGGFPLDQGRYPTRVRVIRYATPPIPDPPPAPAPFPGVTIPDGVVPVHPLFYPGQTVRGGMSFSYDSPMVALVDLPNGTRFQALPNEHGAVMAVGDGEWTIGPPGYARPSWLPYTTSQTERLDGVMFRATDRFAVTAVPDRPGPVTPPDVETRIRNALIAAGGPADVAAGGVHPADWLGDQYPAVQRLVRDGDMKFFQSLDHPAGVVTAGIGPMWPVPGNGYGDRALYSDTPIDGVDPVMLPHGQVNGALHDDHGWIVWGLQSAPIRWYPPQPSTLTDDQVFSAFPAPDGMPADLNVFDRFTFGEPLNTGQVANWLDETPWLVKEVKPTSEQGVALSGTPQTVRVTATPNGPLVETFPFPLGSPEADVAGFAEHGDTIVLPVGDPRLPTLLNRVWWDREVRDGDVAAVERRLAGGYHGLNGEADANGPKVDVRLALIGRSDRLREQATVDGVVRVTRDGDRFVVDPEGVPVAAAQAVYLRPDGDRTVVSLTQPAIRQVLGDAAVTPDYTLALSPDPEVSWQDRAKSLAEQRNKLVLGMPGDASLDSWFDGVDKNLESRLWGSPSASDREHLDRVEAIREYGAAVAHVAALHTVDILADRSRDHEHTGAKSRNMSPDIAASTTRLIASLNLDGATDDSDVAAILERLRIGDAEFRVRGMNAVEERQNTITITAAKEFDDRVRGSAIQFHLGANGEVVFVTAGRQDDWDHHRSWAVTKPGVTAKLRRLAVEQDNNEKLAFARGETGGGWFGVPSVGELAFREVMEQAGVDMSTDTAIPVRLGSTGKVGEAKPLSRANNAAGRATRTGLTPYPRSWTSTLVGRPQTVTFTDEGDYGYGGGSNLRESGSNLVKVGTRVEPNVLVHEFGHSMEAAVPGLVEAEAWYLASRVTGKPQPPEHTGEAFGREIWAYRDEFARTYSGRVYNQTGVAGNASFELFTTAMEQAVARSGRFGPDGSGAQRDESLLEWVVGLLALIDPTPT